ncbi:MAG: hypothetical protein QXP70_01945 [Methanomassiliicoccales archaeon]
MNEQQRGMAVTAILALMVLLFLVEFGLLTIFKSQVGAMQHAYVEFAPLGVILLLAIVLIFLLERKGT